VATALYARGVARGVDVFHLPGAGGAVGLRRLMYEAGNGELMMLMGLGMVGAQRAAKASATLAEVTPVARLIEEPEAFVVTRASPLATVADLVRAWRASPQRLAIGGGSTPGGPDHLAPMLTARALGVPPSSVQYVRYDGGGALLAAVLSGAVSLAVSSLGEYRQQIDSGQLRVLAVTGERRVPGLDVPTLREAGIDVVFRNWRGLVAPPGLSSQDGERLRDIVAQLHASATWAQTMAAQRWTDAFLAGDAFGAFLEDEDTRLRRTLSDLGL
jgi:putative tricarboxylic transport membrane protein